MVVVSHAGATVTDSQEPQKKDFWAKAAAAVAGLTALLLAVGGLREAWVSLFPKAPQATPAPAPAVSSPLPVVTSTPATQPSDATPTTTTTAQIGKAKRQQDAPTSERLVSESTSGASDEENSDPLDAPFAYGVTPSANPSCIYFAFGSSNMAFSRTEEGTKMTYATDLLSNFGSITVVGYGDPDTTGSANVSLSNRRADAVKDWLLSKGIGEQNITKAGVAKKRPATRNLVRAKSVYCQVRLMGGSL